MKAQTPVCSSKSEFPSFFAALSCFSLQEQAYSNLFFETKISQPKVFTFNSTNYYFISLIPFFLREWSILIISINPSSLLTLYHLTLFYPHLQKNSFSKSSNVFSHLGSWLVIFTLLSLQHFCLLIFCLLDNHPFSAFLFLLAYLSPHLLHHRL